MEQKYVILGLCVLVLGLTTATAQPAPLNPFYPSNTPLNMSGQHIYDSSGDINLRDNVSVSNNYLYGLRQAAPSEAPGSAAIAAANMEQAYLSRNGDSMLGTLDMTDNTIGNVGRIEGFFAPSCPDTSAMQNVWPNGSYNCRPIEDAFQDLWVFEEGDSMYGDLVMENGSTVTSLEDPTADSDAMNKGYADGEYLTRSGDSMQGTLDMAGNDITNLGELGAVDSTSRVVNLNADLLDGVQRSDLDWSDMAIATGDVNMDDISPANTNLNMNGNEIVGIGGLNNCGSDEFINGEGNCVADDVGDGSDTNELQDLAEVLNQGNDGGGQSMVNLAGGVSITSNGDISSLSELNNAGGSLHLQHVGSSSRVEIGADSGSVTTDFNNNNLVNIGGLNGCGGDQFVDGDGNCQTDAVDDADADPTNELQDLEDVRSRDNNVNGDIDFQSSGDLVSVENLNVDSINSNRGNGDILFHQGFTVDGDDGGDGSVTLETGNLEMGGNNINNVNKVDTDNLQVSGGYPQAYEVLTAADSNGNTKWGDIKDLIASGIPCPPQNVPTNRENSDEWDGVLRHAPLHCSTGWDDEWDAFYFEPTQIEIEAYDNTILKVDSSFEAADLCDAFGAHGYSSRVESTRSTSSSIVVDLNNNGEWEDGTTSGEYIYTVRCEISKYGGGDFY